MESLRVAGRTAMQAGDYASAVQAYTEALNLDPTNQNATNHILYSNRAAAHAIGQSWSESLNDAQQAVQLNPTWAKGYSRLGAAHHGLGQYADAIAAYQKGYKLDADTFSPKLEEAQKAQYLDYIKFLRRDWILKSSCFERYDKLDEASYTKKSNIHHLDRVVFVTHLWETSVNPDPSNDQFKDVQAYLQTHPEATFVFYDYSSLPQEIEPPILDAHAQPSDSTNRNQKCTHLPGVASERLAAQISQSLLSWMDELYCGMMFPKATSVINICPTKAYLKRSWPCYEVFYSRLYGTLVEGLAHFPLLDECCTLYGLKKSVSFAVIWKLQNPSVAKFKSVRITAALVALSNRAYSELVTRLKSMLTESEFKTLASTLSGTDKTDFEQACSPVQYGTKTIDGAMATLFPNGIAEFNRLHNFPQMGSFSFGTGTLPSQLDLATWLFSSGNLRYMENPIDPGNDTELNEMIDEIVLIALNQGMKYALLATSLTYQRDKDALIISLARKAKANMNQFRLRMDSGQQV